MTAFGPKKQNPFNIKPVAIAGQAINPKQQLQNLTDTLAQRKAMSDGGTRAAPSPVPGASQPGSVKDSVPSATQLGGYSRQNAPLSNGSTAGGAGGRSSLFESSAPEAPSSYNGMSADQYKESLITAVRSGVMTEYEANASIIRNNLNKALADLDSELAALEPLYQNQLQTIAANQYSSSKQTKELMNASGWDASNSGLAVGAQTQIANSADKSRADSAQAKITAETNINRQRSLTEQMAADELATQERIKNEKLSGAEAEALVQADQRNREIYQFNEQMKETRANRTASERASAAKVESSFETAQKDEMYNAALSMLYTQSSQQEIMTYLRKQMSDEGIPDSVKAQLQKDAETLIKMINSDGSVNNPNNSGLDLTQ